ncbi:glycosyltransferase [Scytonema sp. NUACC26]|uniref:glycosyltransferase n=1 Tax=Scytonema sp. NUACC26 TaxID=3140176 RepID=UPI0034DBF8D4
MPTLQHYSTQKSYKKYYRYNIQEVFAGIKGEQEGDTLFQKYLQSYNEAKSQLMTLSAKFSYSHPTVVTQKAELKSAEVSLINRAKVLLKRPASIANINKIIFGNTEVSQTNQGVSTARNQGIYLTNSKLIAFLDADDIWYPDKLASHIAHFNKNINLGISFAKVEFLTPDGKRTGQISKAPLQQLQPQYFFYENPTITVSNLVVRREVFEKITPFDRNMSYAEDLDFLLRVSCSNSWQIEGVNKVLMGYRT